MSQNRLTVAVVGVGAIGAVVASALNSDRADLMLCRQNRGSSVTVHRGAVAAPVTGSVISDPALATPVDWVILATKATVDPRVWLDRLVGPETKIAVVQNGIDLRSRVFRWVPARRALPVTANMSAERIGEDDVLLRYSGDLVIERGPLADEFCGLFRTEDQPRISADYRLEAWRKLMINVVVNSLTTLTGGNSRDCVGPNLLPLTKSLVTEVFHVAESIGVMFAWQEIEDTISRIADFPDIPSSMQTDLRAGRPLEHEFITGAVIRNAEQVGVRVPATSTVHALLSEASPQLPDEPYRPHRRRKALPAVAA